jgi:hypothetical protein
VRRARRNAPGPVQSPFAHPGCGTLESEYPGPARPEAQGQVFARFVKSWVVSDYGPSSSWTVTGRPSGPMRVEYEWVTGLPGPERVV